MPLFEIDDPVRLVKRIGGVVLLVGGIALFAAGVAMLPHDMMAMLPGDAKAAPGMPALRSLVVDCCMVPAGLVAARVGAWLV